MYRDGQEVGTTSLHNFVLNHGALGDVICSLPAIIQARAAHAHMKLKVWCPPWQMDLIRHLLAPYGEFEVLDFTKFPMKKADRMKLAPDDFGAGPVSLNQMPFNAHTRNRVHMVDYAFGCLTDSRPESMLERSYPTKAPLVDPERWAGALPGYVVFPVGATSDNKLFRASVMKPIIEWCLGRGYKPVIVGTKTSHTQAEVGGKLEPIVLRDQADMIPMDRCLDMREKTTLLELRDLLGMADAVVGVDGGTLHLAGTTDVPIVFASGTTLPKHRYIARQGNPSHKIRYVGPRDLECAGCQSNWTMTSLDFRLCAYNDNLCMNLLHHDDFIAGLVELGL